jgi:hypothetical protein
MDCEEESQVAYNAIICKESKGEIEKPKSLDEFFGREVKYQRR